MATTSRARAHWHGRHLLVALLFAAAGALNCRAAEPFDRAGLEGICADGTGPLPIGAAGCGGHPSDGTGGMGGDNSSGGNNGSGGSDSDGGGDCSIAVDDGGNSPDAVDTAAQDVAVSADHPDAPNAADDRPDPGSSPDAVAEKPASDAEGTDASTGTDAAHDAGGCDDSRDSVPVDPCDRSHWKASASMSSPSPRTPMAGIDGDLSNPWSNGRYQDGTDWYVVDFGTPIKASTITLNNTAAYPEDYPGNYEVYVSTDGNTFMGPVATGAGSSPSTVIHFPEGDFRAVKVKQIGTARRNFWWQIGEMQFDCAPP